MGKTFQKKLSAFFLAALLLMISVFPAFASKKTNTGYVYLHFYTIDGDEITDLEKKIRVGRTYTFEDPNLYKYIVYENEDGVIRGENDDLYDTVTGIEWWDETDTDHIETYKGGEAVTFDKEGSHYFRVHTDDPAITGENISISTDDELVYLSFYDENMTPIVNDDEDDYAYDTTITTKDTFTFPDPKDVTSNGIYWACTSDNGTTRKSYLFKAGDKVKFNAGMYEFHIATDDPVEISFYYPFGDVVRDGVEPGDQYGQTFTAKVGESITLYKSPGVVLWGCTFKGWIDENSDDEKVYSGGASFKVMDNQTVHLTMVYEEDENWDLNAKDENGDLSEKKLMNTSENINKQGGTGYDTYVDGSGKLASKYTPKLVNSNSVLRGVPSTYKSDKELTSLKEDGNENEASSYQKDKYGYDMDESKITDPDMGDVLKQDNSAYQMDVYGNSMMYHQDLSRIDDMCVAWIRLYEMKNSVPSFVAMIQDWDQEEINRYEAIEFALLSQEYPGKENSIYKRWNSTTDKEVVAAKAKGVDFAPIQDAKIPEWKDEYLSESAFNALKYTKTLFSGWADTYNDGVYEAYKGTADDIHTVTGAIKSISNLSSITSSIQKLVKNINLSSAIDGTLDKFRIVAYAENNGLSAAKQYGSHITHSLDNETQTFRRQFFDKSKVSRYSAYTIGNLDGLTAEQMETLQIVYNYFTSNGFSEAMAAGACGNLWQECTFVYADGLTGNDKSYVGLVQWGGDRKTALKAYAASKGTSAADLTTQLEYLMQELNAGYLKKINAYISAHGSGQTAATVTDVQLATDAWCIYVEGCVCHTSSGLHSTHSSACAIASNGKSYQELGTRRQHAEAVMNAQQAGGSNTQLVVFAKSFLGVPYRWGGDDPAGFDCSGFSRYVLNHFGAGIDGGSKSLSQSAGTEVPINPSTLQPGDLIFYAKKSGEVNHVVIYIGDGLIIGANGGPTVFDASGNAVYHAYGKGEVNIQKYNYRTPVKARRCLSALSTAYQTVGTAEETESTTEE